MASRLSSLVELEATAIVFPLQIGRDYVLGRALDDFDVSYVVLYALTRPGILQ